MANQQVDTSDEARLAVTVGYLRSLHEMGVSSAVAQCRLAGVSFNFETAVGLM